MTVANNRKRERNPWEQSVQQLGPLIMTVHWELWNIAHWTISISIYGTSWLSWVFSFSKSPCVCVTTSEWSTPQHLSSCEEDLLRGFPRPHPRILVISLVLSSYSLLTYCMYTISSTVAVYKDAFGPTSNWCYQFPTFQIPGRWFPSFFCSVFVSFRFKSLFVHLRSVSWLAPLSQEHWM